MLGRYLIDILAGASVVASWWGNHLTVIATTLAVVWYTANLLAMARRKK